MIRRIRSFLRRFRERNYLDEEDLRNLHVNGDAAFARLKKRIPTTLRDGPSTGEGE